MLAINDLYECLTVNSENHKPLRGPSAGLLSVGPRETKGQQLSYFLLLSHLHPRPPPHPSWGGVAAGMRWYLSKQTVCSQRRLDRPQEAPLFQPQ